MGLLCPGSFLTGRVKGEFSIEIDETTTSGAGQRAVQLFVLIIALKDASQNVQKRESRQNSEENKKNDVNRMKNRGVANLLFIFINYNKYDYQNRVSGIRMKQMMHST